MESIGCYEAKTHLAKLLERVARGESITITRHGRPVAVLQPVEAAGKKDVAAVIKEIIAFGRKHSRKGLSIRDMIEEGRH